MIKGIVDNYPTEGPLKIEGFFDVACGHVEKVFNQWKGNVVEQFPDPRLHFALVCAALDCQNWPLWFMMVQSSNHACKKDLIGY